MDPISAAGIGLSIASLALQVFAGCVTAYELFAEAEGMPAAYQYLRVRLRFEQTRLLRWGEKVGLVEELLDQPSQVLQLNRNLIIDMLLEIQAAFKSVVKIQAKYDFLVPDKSLLERKLDPGDPKSGTDGMLKKTLRVFNKVPEVPQRLQWAFIKQDEFKGLIEKLIGFNNSIEALLEIGAIDQLLTIQRQTYMSVIQLNSKVDDLKVISLAMQVQTKTPPPLVFRNSNTTRAIQEQQNEIRNIASLADFKAQQNLPDNQPSNEVPIHRSEIALHSDKAARCQATFRGHQVWIEWKDHDLYINASIDWGNLIEERVKKLVSLLRSPNKSPEFRAPECLGYFEDKSEDYCRYGFIYMKPKDASLDAVPISLLDLILTAQAPSLTQRISLAHAMARCLMYLHSVNWIHKGFRSSNIIFFAAPGSKPSYGNPILSGFDYARLDLVGEVTEPVPEHSEYDIYRHPSTLNYTHSRSKKSHDIYGLGVVLIEIAYWKKIDEIVGLPKGENEAKKMVRKVRQMLLDDRYLEEIQGLVGDLYGHAVRKCLEGVVDSGANETDPVIGAEIQKAFSYEVVDRLRDIKL